MFRLPNTGFQRTNDDSKVEETKDKTDNAAQNCASTRDTRPIDVSLRDPRPIEVMALDTSNPLGNIFLDQDFADLARQFLLFDTQP
jgi:hypothetical protein